MSRQDDHQRASYLIAERMIAALGEEDALWLESHLELCATCAAEGDSTARAVGTLRMASEMPDPGLVRATQRTARLYASRLGETESQRRMFVVSVVVAAMWGALLQPYLWQLFGWLGGVLSLSEPVWQTVFLMTWLVPGIAVALVLIHWPSRIRWMVSGGRGREGDGNGE